MRHGILPATFILLLACAQTKTNVVDMGSGLRPPPKPDDCPLPIFRTQKPTRPYAELATIETIGAAVTDTEDVNRELKARACKLGADAVVITDTPSENPGCGGYSGPSVKGVAIVYTAGADAGASSTP